MYGYQNLEISSYPMYVLNFLCGQREREKWQSSERHYIYLFKKERIYPARPSGRDSAFNWD
jgi:hypothetical protein